MRPTSTEISGRRLKQSQPGDNSDARPSAASTNPAMELALQTLQPIRDLSRNWDVDIASCLEEYLQELTGLASTDGSVNDSGITSNNQNSGNSGHNEPPNFAHAALILQNSSNVYSRKVEYLHSLVYKALQEFFQASVAAKSCSGNRRNTVDADIEEFFEFDPHENFLLLDDVVPEDVTHRKINLKDEDESGFFNRYSNGNTPAGRKGERSVSTGKSKLNATRLSLGGLSVTRLERSSLGGGISSGGSLQQQRALLGILNNGSLRLINGQCDVDDDGMLLMPGSRSARTSFGRDSSGSEPAADFSSGEPRSLFGNNENDIGQQAEENIAWPDDDGDDDNDGPGFELNDDIDDEGFTNRDSDTTLAKKVTFAEQPAEVPKMAKKKDPWELLDPHSTNSPSYSAKPLRKGKTTRLPDGISKPPSECVSGARTIEAPQPKVQSLKLSEMQPSLAVETFRVLTGEQFETTVKISNNGLAYGNEFLYIAKENAKRKAAERRAEKKKEEFGKESRLVERNYYSGNDFDDEYDDGFGGDFDGPDDDYDDDADNVGGNTGFDSVDDVILRSKSQGDGNSGKTFEELCRAHIEAFAKGAEKYAMNTKLTDRVGEWQEKLAPILAAEEERGCFDIHLYSEKLIENASDGVLRGKRKCDGSTKVQTKQNSVEFSSVTKGCTRSDVCRFFLASLSLANAGNLEIQEDHSEFCFRLISHELAKPMETYRAPSLESSSE